MIIGVHTSIYPMGGPPNSPTIALLNFESLTPGSQWTPPAWLTFTRSSDQYTVQTSASTVTSGLTGNNVAYIGNRGGAAGKSWANGLSLEESRIQRVETAPRRVDQLPVAQGTYAQTGNGPDGTATPYRAQLSSGQTASGSWTGAPSAIRTASEWVLRGSAGGLYQMFGTDADAGSSNTPSPTSTGIAAPTTWTRVQSVGQLAGTKPYMIAVDGTTETGGLAAGARDVIVDFMQIEDGSFPTEAISTGSATRATPRIVCSDRSKLLDSSGRLWWVTDITLAGAPAQYAAPIQVTPYFSASDAGASISNSTGRLSVTIGGSTWSPSTPLDVHLWAGRRVQIAVCAGGGTFASRAKIRFTDDGSVLDLGSNTAQSAITLAGNADVLNVAGGNIPTGLVHSIEARRTEPAWFTGGTPTWTPMALAPEMWLRADLGVTVGTGVSSWADQTGNGHNATQGTGSLQPLFIRSDYGGRPGILFAASHRLMLAGTLPLINGEIISVIRSTANSSAYAIALYLSESGPFMASYKTLNDGRAGFYIGTSGGFQVSSGVAPSLLTPTLLSVRGQNADHVAYTRVNSAETSTNNGWYGASFNGHLGAASGNVQPMYGVWYESIVCSRMLTTAERSAVFAYLNNRYGQGWTI